MWSADSHGIRNIKGEIINAAKDAADPQHNNYLMLGGRWLPMNFGIWWDGDLLREMLDRGRVSKYNWENRTLDDVYTFPGIVFNNGTKSNPCLSADILGDWREEVIARTPDSSELRIFVSPIPTDYRINCLMEDIPSVGGHTECGLQPTLGAWFLPRPRRDRQSIFEIIKLKTITT